MGTEAFQHFSAAAARHLGSPWAFLSALLLIAVWALTGPIFDFNETWQLVINTGTTIITFIMVFLIQATQNRESKALQLKIDELIRAGDARNVFAALEDASEEELNAFQREFRELRKQGASHLEAALAAHEEVLASDSDQKRKSGAPAPKK
jgi:low affinity Fe/Cu permease